MDKYISPELKILPILEEAPLAQSYLSGEGRNDDFNKDDTFNWD